MQETLTPLPKGKRGAPVSRHCGKTPIPFVLFPVPLPSFFPLRHHGGRCSSSNNTIWHCDSKPRITVASMANSRTGEDPLELERIAVSLTSTSTR